MSSKPRYWDTENGKVLKAIVTSEHRTRSEIRDITGFTDEKLNQILADLFISDLISKTGSSYWIEDYDLFCEYRDYIKGNYDSKFLSKEYREEQEKIRALREESDAILTYIEENGYENTVIRNVIWWSLREGIKYRVFSEHFFIEGDLLDRLCKDVIDFSKTKILVINPFVDQCSLSDKLKDAGLQGKDVTLLTRSPLSESAARVRTLRKKYHDALHQSGVKIFYNDRLHSKIILSDDILGIVSSMNFKSESSSGKNLEAGMVAWQKQTIESLNNYVVKLLNDYETKEFFG